MDLVVQEGDGPERRVHVAGTEAIVGRSPECDVVVDKPYVSKQHVKLLSGRVLVDLASSNGTFVNEAQVQDSVVLGDSWLTLGRGDVRIRIEREDPTKLVPAVSMRERELESEVEALRGGDPEQVARLTEESRRLTEENAKLRAGLVELRARAAVQLPQDASTAQKLLFQVQRENGVLKRELIKARAELEERGPGPSDSSAKLSQVQALLQEVEDVPIAFDAELDEFLLVESFRFLRRVERIVSRLAGGLIQLFSMETTMVPGSQGNTRELVGALMRGPDDQAGREQLLEYLQEIGRWFVVALGSQKVAARRFAAELREELSEKALLGEASLSLLKRKETELWRLTQEHLAELTDERVEERLDALARSSSMELLEKGDANPFGDERS